MKKSVRLSVVSFQCLAVALALFICRSAGADAAFTSLCADRAAVERVYHEHRTGTKPPFEQAMPAALLEKLVRADLKKEAALASVYGVTITGAMVEAEVARINATTRAPEMLAEIKAALGNDAARFASAMARPIVVERTLRARFEYDDKLHAPQRAIATKARDAALAAGAPAIEAMRKLNAGTIAETTWILTPRPADEKPVPAPPDEPVKGTAKSASYSVESTTRVAQPLSPPADGEAGKHYFEDLAPELQNVLRAQLQKPGDISAVIETPAAFLVFITKGKTAVALDTSTLTIPKRSYDEWLAQQPDIAK